ncbi:MAG: purine biosynthesis protein PurH [Clostridia bacterium]|nr:purine biosynthesis protein PurH [Clostridia bacterium]
MAKSLLIRDTTREEREQIVLRALSDSEVSCEDSVSDHDIALYQPYIDGEMELRECTMAFRSGYVRGAQERPGRGTCGFSK